MFAILHLRLVIDRYLDRYLLLLRKHFLSYHNHDNIKKAVTYRETVNKV